MTAVKILKVENKDRKFGAASEYFYIRAAVPTNSASVPVDLLFTDDELAVAAERAANNPEDHMALDPDPNPVMDVFRDLLGL